MSVLLRQWEYKGSRVLMAEGLLVICQYPWEFICLPDTDSYLISVTGST